MTISVLKRAPQLNPLTLLMSAFALLTGCDTHADRSLPKAPIYFSHSTPSDTQLAASFGAGVTQAVSTKPKLLLYFDSDSAILRDDDLERLQSFILSVDSKSATRFLIRGHTDSEHTTMYNTQLSMRRALATQRAMHAMGIQVSRTLLNAGGENIPVAENTTALGRQANRRVSIEALNSLYE